MLLQCIKVKQDLALYLLGNEDKKLTSKQSRGLFYQCSDNEDLIVYCPLCLHIYMTKILKYSSVEKGKR